MRLLIVSIICSLFTISLQTNNFMSKELNEENEQIWSRQLTSDINGKSQTDDMTNNLLGGWKPVYHQPEQIHISLGANEFEMTVTWVTFDKTISSTVRYGREESHFTSLNMTKTGQQSLFVDGGTEKRRMYIHRVTLTDLTPDKRYVYQCGSQDGWSPIFNFKTFKSGVNWSPKFLIYGDLGNDNAQSIGRLQDEVQKQGVYDAVLHVGDMAYDLHTDNARVGDEFMRQIEPVAAYVPYQVLPGNHEMAYNFSNYDARFSMVNSGTGKPNNHFWSYNIGPIHFISFSTEFYYFTQFGTHQIKTQFEWLERDLKEANKPENRAKRPWIIAMGHRPIYCQNHVDQLLRLGFVFQPSHKPEYGLEELFFSHGVDMYICGHEHNYERTWPIHNNKIFNGSVSSPYTNPKAPVYLVTGSPGNRERHTTLVPKPPAYSAFRNSDYGYTRMQVMNASHLYFEQVSDDKKGALVDKVWIIKDKHGPEAWM